MNNPKQILWTDQNSMPPKNYLWQKGDSIYECIDGSWIKAKAFGTTEDCECEEENEEECVNMNDVSKTITEELVKQVELDYDTTVPRELVAYPDKFVQDGVEKEEISNILEFIKLWFSSQYSVIPVYCEQPSDPEKIYVASGFSLHSCTETNYDILPLNLINGETVYFMIDHSSRPKSI